MEKQIKSVFDKMEQCLQDFHWVKDHVFLRTCNRERDSRKIHNSVHVMIGDVAVAAYLQISEIEDYQISSMVQREQLVQWNVSAKELYQLALENTAHQFPARVYNWQDVCRAANDENFALPLRELSELPPGEPFLCLTTSRCTNGSIAIFLPGVAETLCEYYGEDICFGFTSIHEAMVHPISQIDLDGIHSALNGTIEEAGVDDEFLSGHVFGFTRSTGKFFVY